MEARWTSRLHLPCCCYCCSTKLPILLLFIGTFLAYHYVIMITMNAAGIANCDPRTAAESSVSSSSSQFNNRGSTITVRRANVTKYDSTKNNHQSFKRTLLADAGGPDRDDAKWTQRSLLKHRHLHSKLRKAKHLKSWNRSKGARLRNLKLQQQYLMLAKQNPENNPRDRWKEYGKHVRTLGSPNDVEDEAKPATKVKQSFNSTLHNPIKSRTSSKRFRPSNSSNNNDEDNHMRGKGLQSNDIVASAKSSNATATQRRLPQALIIGVKKGGTRALLEFIRLHPDVRAVGPETHFFDRHYHRGLHWYRQQMPPTLDSQLTMEKTPSYFVTREVPRRIFSMAQDIKLLVVVRDPVTRAISDYAQTVSKRRHMRSFDQLAFLNNVTRLVDTSWGAIKIGVYARHLENWLQYFPLRQFHFVSGERLIKDPAGEIAKVQDFLGVRRIVTENHFYFNETKGFPCLKKSERNGSLRCLGKTKGRTHPNVDNSTLHHLRDFFRPFNMKFYQMTGVDFGWP